MRPFVYEAPTDAATAVALASVPASAHITSPVQFKGGGTTLIDLMKLDVMRPTTVVDITTLDEPSMHRIVRSDDGLKIGSLVSMASLHDDKAMARDYPILTESLWQAASQQLRNMARLGGNVVQRTRCNYFRDTSYEQCNKRVPGSGCSALDGANRQFAVLGTSDSCIALYAGDWAPALIALDAQVEVLGSTGVRVMPFANLHRLPGTTPHIETNLAPGELITAFIVPGGPRRRSLYRKIRDRESYEFANASAAVALELDGAAIRDVRIGLGGVATVPWRAHRAEEMLRGETLTEDSARAAAEAEFAGAQTRKDNAYKVPLGKATIVRALFGCEGDGDFVTVSKNVAATALLPDMGQPIRRTESIAKVTGKLVYATDASPEEMPLQAYFLTSGIARGRILSIDTTPATALYGVVKVYTHENAPDRIATPYTQKGGYVSDTNMPLIGPEIHHDGEIIAMVVAETYEIARDATHRIVTRYAPAVPAATMDSPGVDIVHLATLAEKEKKVGDFAAAFAAAPVKVGGQYRTAAQHQNPIELYSTTASWSGGELTIHEPSQFVVELANGAAAMTGVSASAVHVINPHMGGAFGGKGYMTQRTALIACAARELKRPVRNVVTRDQGFTLATYRAETKHHVQLAADREGHLLAYGHESWEMQSRYDDYPLAGFGVTTAMYGKPAIQTRVNMVKADRQTSGFMRAPVEMPYMYALENAMDELAVALDMDPIELRRVNDIRESPIDGARFTSRSLMRCFDEAAASFGWKNRNPKPGSMREGDWLIGYGCASAPLPTHTAPATARVTLRADGDARVDVAGQDSGQGTYTALSQIAAAELKLDPKRVRVVMGDSKLPAAPASANSLGTASIGSAVKLATDKIRARFGSVMPADGERMAAFARLGVSEISELGEYLPYGQKPEVITQLRKGKVPFKNQARGDESTGGKPLMSAFGAQFVEVRIHRLTREIRVPRMTGAFAAGRIINTRTARSQLMGGMIWGMQSALLEVTAVDEKRGRFVKDGFGGYLIAVNADVPRVDVHLVPEEDNEVNPLGVKGIGELGIVGTAAAVASAVHHATGIRIRDLPIVVDKLLV